MEREGNGALPAIGIRQKDFGTKPMPTPLTRPGRVSAMSGVSWTSLMRSSCLWSGAGRSAAARRRRYRRPQTGAGGLFGGSAARRGRRDAHASK